MCGWLLVACGIVGFILIVGLLILVSMKTIDIIEWIQSDRRN